MELTLVNNLAPMTTRDKVFAVEHEMKKGADFEPSHEVITEEDVGKKIKLKVRHHFSDGIYARELFIPKGVILTGHIHKYYNLNILSKGKLEVLVGDEIQILEAPATIVSPPGTKRIARALEDTVWVTIHKTDSVDLAKIENEFIAHNEEEYLEFKDSEPMLPLVELKLLD